MKGTCGVTVYNRWMDAESGPLDLEGVVCDCGVHVQSCSPLMWVQGKRCCARCTHTAAAWGTVALELSLPFLIWDRRWRWLLICASVAMHTGIALTMGLTAFSLFMICILFAFVPPETVKGAIAWAKGKLARLPLEPAARREEVREVARV